jgi:hypothetical protein
MMGVKCLYPSVTTKHHRLHYFRLVVLHTAENCDRFMCASRKRSKECVHCHNFEIAAGPRPSDTHRIGLTLSKGWQRIGGGDTILTNGGTCRELSLFHLTEVCLTANKYLAGVPVVPN